MGDALDGAMDTGNEEEEANSVYMQICDEIGVDINEEQQVNKEKISMGAPAQVAVRKQFNSAIAKR